VSEYGDSFDQANCNVHFWTLSISGYEARVDILTVAPVNVGNNSSARLYGRIAGAALVGAAMLCWPMILNGFPFIFHDTNSYVRLNPEIPRSYFYKLFVFFTGFHKSIWTTAFAQTLLASICILILMRMLGFLRIRHFLLAMTTLSLASSLPIFASFIMPDIFTGIMCIALFVTIFNFEETSLKLRAFLFLVLLVSISAHLSHLALALALTFASLAWLLAFARGRSRKGVGLVLLACTLVAAAFTLYHGIKHHRFVLSAAGSTFFLANLLEHGPARQELKDHCPQSGYRLCLYRTALPATANEFLWNPKSPFNSRLGGFEGMMGESDRLVRDTLRDRPLSILSESIENSWRAVFALDSTADLGRPDTSVPQLRRVFLRVYGLATLEQFDASLQERNRFPKKYISIMNYTGIIIALSAEIYMLIIRRRSGNKNLSLFLSFSIAVYFSSAVLCGTLSNVADRYQARVTWLLLLAIILLVLDKIYAKSWREGASSADGSLGISFYH
jgi:hypothetical protein